MLKYPVIEKRLYDIANNLVGTVYEHGDTITAPNGDSYIEFGIRFRDDSDLEKRWTDFINGYMRFVEFRFYGVVEDNPCLSIYWRVSPDISYDSETGFRYVYARFIISK